MAYVSDLRKMIGNAPLELPGTGVIVYRKDSKETKFLVQHRADNDLFGLLGGGLELCETFRQCAKRELIEEANILCDVNDFILLEAYAGKEHVTIYPNGDVVHHSVIVFSIDYDRCVHLEWNNNPETKDLKWVTLGEIQDLLAKNLVFPNNAPILEDLVEGKFLL